MTSKLKTLIITALTPSMVLAQGVFPRAVQSSNIGDKSRLLIAEAKTTPDLTPASAGVKLLRQIFQKLRNPQNQLALNYSNSNRQLLAATQSAQSVLNQSLMIRPPEKSSNMNQAIDARLTSKMRRDMPSGGFGAAAPKLAMAAPATASYAGASSASYLQSATNATNALAKDASAGYADDDAAMDAKTLASPKEAFRSRAHKKAVAPSSTPAASFSTAGSAAAGAGGSIGGTYSQGKVVANPELTPGSQQMLARTMSRVMQSTRQMGSQLTQATNEASVHNFGANKAEVRAERTISTEPGGPLIQEFNSDKSTTANSVRDQFASSNARGVELEQQAPLMKPESPSSYKIMRNQLLALLPTSVVEGIPIARLGASEKELLATTLNDKNVASKQIIDDWTIWTIKSSKSQRLAVQLYMRHSIVEAIRVFQPSYLGPEVGVNVGDSLLAIKNKFGEPSFILDEPGSKNSASSNYVYPISHVAFQLAVSKAQPKPEVVSVLIFEPQ